MHAHMGVSSAGTGRSTKVYQHHLVHLFPAKLTIWKLLWQKVLCLQLAELRKKLEELHSTASADHLAKVELESRQHRLHGDSSRLEKRLAAVEADRESLSHQLKASCIPACPSVCLSVCLPSVCSFVCLQA